MCVDHLQPGNTSLALEPGTVAQLAALGANFALAGNSSSAETLDAGFAPAWILEMLCAAPKLHPYLMHDPTGLLA